MKLSLWSLRKLAFLNVFITDKLFRMFRPYFLSLDFVSLNCHHVCMCGLLTPWVSWGEVFSPGGFARPPPSASGQAPSLSCHWGCAQRKQACCQAPEKGLPQQDGLKRNINDIGFSRPSVSWVAAVGRAL